MGIFEKSIPKYVVNPIDQRVEVAPQDVYVDDIFDPILNANVRNAMRQKYGDGIVGIAGGYKELLKNVWTGREGTLGKGMGLLSTFGRSMDKAGDVILGTLTEGVEGLSGQGFDNPLENIFVNDEDYTGKRFLASTANVMSPLVGGTRVTEDDLGTAWNIPALGVDLATDPGILGGGLARKFAPAAKNFTSKELFQNLGKSDVKTTVGEIGQLMSNYDDLMARVSIDIAAPGLRRAFRRYRNNIAQRVKAYSERDYANASKEYVDPNAPSPGPNASAGSEQPDPLTTELIQLYQNVKNVEETIPFDIDELERMDLRTPSQVKQEVVDNMPSYFLENRFLMPPRESKAGSRTDYLNARKEELRKKLDESFRSRGMDVSAAISQMMDAARRWGVNTDQIGVDRSLGPVSEDLNTVRDLIENTFLKEYYNYSNTAPVKPAKLIPNPYVKHQVYDSMFDALDLFENPSALGSASEFLKNPTSKSIQQWRERYPTLDKHLEKYTANQTDWQKYFDSLNRSSEPGPSLNRSYIDDVIDTLSSDEKLKTALETGIWSDNEAVNDALNKLVFNDKNANFPYYKRFNKDFTVSPSLISNFDHVSGPLGLSYSDEVLDIARYSDLENNSFYFNSPEELDTFFNSDEANTLLNSVFPPFDGDLDSAVQINSINKFKRLLKNAYYPAADVSGFDRMQNLQDLADFVNTRKNWVRDDLRFAAPSQTEFLERLIPAMEEIDTDYLRKLFPVKSQDAFASGDVDLIEYAQEWLSQNSPHFKSQAMFKDIIEPLKPYAQITVKKSGKHPVSKEIYEYSKNEVREYVKEVLPLLEEFLHYGGNPFPSAGKVPFRPYKFSEAKHEKLLTYLGYRKGPQRHVAAFRKLTNLVLKGKDVDEFRGKYADLSYKTPTLGKDGRMSMETKQLDASSALVSTKILTPTDLTTSANYPGTSLHDSILKAIESGQNTAPVLEHLSNVSSALRNILPDIGIASEKELSELIKKSKINDGVEQYRNATSKLSIVERRKLQAYVLFYENLVKQVPFRLIERDIVGFSPENMYKGVFQHLESMLNSGDIPYKDSDRVRRLLIRENAINAYRFGYAFDDFSPSVFGQRFRNFLDAKALPDTLSRDSVLSNINLRTHLVSKKTPGPILTHTPTVREFENILAGFRRAEAEDFARLQQFEQSEAAIRAYAASKGSKYKAPKFDRTLKRRMYVSKHFGTSLDEFEDLVDDYRRAEANDLARIQDVRSFETDNLQRYPYTEKTRELVQKAFIDKLPYKYSSAWDPSPEKGLFHFDIRDNEIAKAMYVSDSFDIVEGDYQRMLRYGLGGYRELQGKLVNGKYKPFMQYVDYTLLQSKKGIDKLSKMLADEMFQMDYYADTRSKVIPISNTVANIVKSFDDYRINTKSVSDAIERIDDAIVGSNPVELSKQAYAAPSIAETIADDFINEHFEDINSYMRNGGTEDSAKRTFGKKRWELYKMLDDARAIPRTNATLETRATLRTERAIKAAKRFELVRSYTTPKDWDRTIKLITVSAGDVVPGQNFWNEFRRTGGMFVVPLNTPNALKTLNALKHNSEVINNTVGAPVVDVIESKFTDGVEYCIMRWNDNKGDSDKLIPRLKKAYKKLDTAKFEDVEFLSPRELTPDEFRFMQLPHIKELVNCFDELQSIASDQYKYLGFNYDASTPYVKHVMRHDIDTATWLNKNIFGTITSEEHDDIARLISNFDGYRKTDKGTFGTSVQSRRFRGAFWNLENPDSPIFSRDPVEIFNSTLGEGAFANMKVQTFVDLFINDNFKIKGYFNTVDDLKDVLYKTDASGNLSGNLYNLDLVTYRLDENGKISKLHFFDKMSDAGLEKALADPNTILIPSSTISNLDNAIRKEARYSNKAFSFINKYFTVPFKIGILTNPGFILGNMSDASLKLATDMSEKYGTTLTEEVAKVTECVNATIHLKNNFSNVFKKWLETADEFGIKLSPESRIPDIVSMSPKHRKLFVQYLNGTLTVKVKNPETNIIEDIPLSANLSKQELEETYAYLLVQELQLNSSKLREFADLADLDRSTRFDVSSNIFDRVIRGKRKYSAKKPSSWGLFMNNPITEGFSKASGTTEEIARTAAILDDLRHKGYSFEDMANHFKSYDDTTGEHLKFGADLSSAKNTMFHSQFDYERINDTYENIGKVMPFPIFFLQNLYFWLELFDKNPQYVENAISIQEGLWSGYNEEGDEFKTEAMGRGAVPIGGKTLPDWFKGIYKPTPLQSMFGAFNLLNNPIDNLTYRVNPLISGTATAVSDALPDNELTTLLQNPDSVKYRPYSTNMYERNVKQGDPNFNPLKYTLHRMNPYDRAMNAHLRLPDKVKEGEAQLSDVLPSVFQPVF